ncbi:hypothetical protein MPTK1_3g19690 [Marchantia polymorpha subsp. ruderalis]|uniref:Uncharacterized protein n=2 Tax=Marchantia polymorpha TaxID=3197 RepID=A0AAF6B2N4_MARPO|nr:hypothetical protein MARPO_0049s0065 [Marchantia polymorpha]BBN06268.1 hypothetical protein Mp_3g19690 [Marchantia polymorpha subsp. ruderalis]|eukprot:PTQ38775.1 hypothetical protein MARPO_0049s0065 [Marchantia polymorpha]
MTSTHVQRTRLIVQNLDKNHNSSAQNLAKQGDSDDRSCPRRQRQSWWPKSDQAARDRDIMEYSSSKGIAGVKFEDKKGLGGCRVQ